MKAPKSELAKQLLQDPSTARALRLAVECAVSAERLARPPHASFIVGSQGHQRQIHVEVVPITS